MIPESAPTRPNIYQMIEGLKAELSDLKRINKAQNDEIDKLRDSVAVLNHLCAKFGKQETKAEEPKPEQTKIEPKFFTVRSMTKKLQDSGFITSTQEVSAIILRRGYVGINNSTIYAKKAGIEAGICVPLSRSHCHLTEKCFEFLKSYLSADSQPEESKK